MKDKPSASQEEPFFDLVRMPSGSNRTIGMIYQGEIPICLSLELPWLDNKRNVSCIPAGVYDCLWVVHPRWPNSPVALVREVKDRSGILIHPANAPKEIRGCIALGLELTETGVGQSINAVKKLRNFTKGTEFFLRISWSSRTMQPITNLARDNLQ